MMRMNLVSASIACACVVERKFLQAGPAWHHTRIRSGMRAARAGPPDRQRVLVSQICIRVYWDALDPLAVQTLALELCQEAVVWGAHAHLRASCTQVSTMRVRVPTNAMCL